MPRPLSKTYDKTNPFVVERHDEEDGSISYEIWDTRPDSYRRLCVCQEDYVDDQFEAVEQSAARPMTAWDRTRRQRTSKTPWSSGTAAHHAEEG